MGNSQTIEKQQPKPILKNNEKVNVTLSKKEFNEYKHYIENKNKNTQNQNQNQNQNKHYYTTGLLPQYKFNRNIGHSTQNRNQDYVDINNIPLSCHSPSPILDTNTMVAPNRNKSNSYVHRPQSICSSKIKVDEKKTIEKNVDINKLDPFNILEKKQLSLQNLKKCYKKLAFINHPDKGGNVDTFNTIIKAYEYIEETIQMQKIDKTHLELKNNYDNDVLNEHKPQNTKLKNIWNKDNFNIHKFNEIYEETKFNNNMDDGYNNIMVKTSSNRDDIDISNNIGKYNKNTFNRHFEDNKKKNMKKQVMKYTPPSALEPSFNDYTILGEENISDFSGRQGNIEYTDYKKAHYDGFLIQTDQVGYKTYNSIEDLNKDREDLSMNSEHMNEIEQNQLKREKIEWERQERLKQQDIDIGIHYRKVNKYMLNN